MASSPDFVRSSSGATRALADAAFDALPSAVVVVDARLRHLPLVMANAAARQCLQDAATHSLVDSSLYSWLGPTIDSVIQSLLHGTDADCLAATRVLVWRLPCGEVPLSTEIKLLGGGAGQRMVMLSFVEPAPNPAALADIEQAPLDLVILDRDLKITYANAGASRRSGPVDCILDRPGVGLLPAGIPRAAFDDVLTGGHYHDAVSVPVPGGPARCYDVDMQPLQDESGIVGLAVLWTEVTARSTMSEAAFAQEHPWRALTEHARDIITVAASDGRLNFISGGITSSLGYTADERRSQSIFEHVHADDVEPLRAQWAELVRGTIPRFSYQFRIWHKDGSLRWLESHYVSALTNPLIRGVVVNSRDITERRQAELRLAQREEVFRLAADAVNGIIFEWDLGAGVVHRSRGVFEVLGIPPEELAVAGAWSARIHPQDNAEYREKIRAAFGSDANGWTATYRIRDARGRYRSMLERALIQCGPDGDPVRAIGCCVDVSEIKRLTDLLAETQQAASVGGWEYIYGLGELTWTEETYRIFETAPRAFKLSWDAMVAQCRPESRQRLLEACAVAEASGDGFDLELEISTLANRSLWVRIIGHVELLEGRPFRSFGSVQNVQVQKLAQIALSNSTRWLKLSMNMANLHAWRWDRVADTLEFAALDDRPDVLSRVLTGMQSLIARVHPKERTAVRRAIDQAFETRAEVEAQFRLRTRAGHYRWYAAIARPLFDAVNQLSGLVGVTQDVTARYDAEARLRRSEELLRTTTSNTADTLVLLDRDLRVRFINRPLRDLSIDQLIGQPVAILIPSLERDRVLAKLRQVLSTTEPVQYDFAHTTPGGVTEYYENRAVLVRDEGSGAGISITLRNITERKRLEQEILEVSSRERQTIGRDLHDGLGQELTGVALMLRGLATRLQKHSPAAVAQVNEIVGVVNQSIETARSLARGLLPVNTEGGGLALALQALADRSRELYGLAVHFRGDVASDLGVSETSASHLYRIAQEALTNSARHGCASEVAIYLQLSRERLLLEITDNGRGIDRMQASTGGMGLKIMRYRAGMIGAQLDIVRALPRGTVVRVSGEQPMLTGAVDSAPAL
jgi:PAS domain S-box-containing protein